MTRTLIVALVSVFALLGLAQPAFAHNTLTTSDPKDGSSIAAGPEQITLTFDQAVQAGEGNQVVIGGPGKTRWADGAVEVEDNVVRTELPPLGPKGEYTIGYRVLSADGHVVNGVVSFTLTEPGDGKPLAGSTGTATDDGLPLWVWIGGAVVLLAVGLVLALRMGREQE